MLVAWHLRLGSFSNWGGSMGRFMIGIVSVGLMLGFSHRALAADEAFAIIDKAVKAHGGAEKMAKLKAVQTKGKGKLEIMGQKIPFTRDGFAQLSGQVKEVLQLDINGMQITTTV